MKTFYLLLILLLFFIGKGGYILAQTSSITSGGIYMLKSNVGKKCLNVSNSSMDNGANVNGWTNTGSDAERWVVTTVRRGIYTLKNVASGKLLHIAATVGDSVNVDQYTNTNSKDVEWIIKKAGNGSYYLQSAANTNLYLTLNTRDTSDGTNAYLSISTNPSSSKWLFQRETTQKTAPSAATADKVFEAWYNQYKVETGKGFWDRAEMMEILLDAYEVTKNTRYLTRFNTMYTNFLAANQSDWMYNKYNDDVTWAVLFCVRGYLLTGNKSYLEKGKEQFDKMYARANTNTFGGGLIWYETKTSKNACINGPAMVACCYLAKATGDKTYYDKAIALYNWSKVYLFNPATGKVNDNVDVDKEGKIKMSTWSSTYNQGTYLGAATMLYNYTKQGRYLAEAQKIAQYTRDSMYSAKVINNEDGGNDLPGFKGIFARYARTFAVEGSKSDLNDWLRLNAKVAYNNRNSQNLIQTKWGTRTSEIKPKSEFGSSSAVSLLINSHFLQHSK